MIKNPLTGKMIKVDGKTAQNLLKNHSEILNKKTCGLIKKTIKGGVPVPEDERNINALKIAFLNNKFKDVVALRLCKSLSEIGEIEPKFKLFNSLREKHEYTRFWDDPNILLDYTIINDEDVTIKDYHDLLGRRPEIGCLIFSILTKRNEMFLETDDKFDFISSQRDINNKLEKVSISYLNNNKNNSEKIIEKFVFRHYYQSEGDYNSNSSNGYESNGGRGSKVIKFTFGEVKNWDYTWIRIKLYELLNNKEEMFDIEFGDTLSEAIQKLKDIDLEDKYDEGW